MGAPRIPLVLGWGLAALAVRLALAARAPIIEVDGAYWAGLAAALERGDFRHGLHTGWPPLYPALIAACLRVARVFGRPPDPATLEAAARAASVLAGTLLLLPLCAIARRLLSPRAAGIAVLLAMAHPRMLHYSAAALSETTFTMFLLLGLAFMIAREQGEPALPREAAAGATFGLAYLARPEALPLAVLVWLSGLFIRPGGARPAGTTLARGSRWRPAFALALVVVALPWLLFLHGTLGRWSLGEKGEYNFSRAFAAAGATDFPAPPGIAERVNDSPEIAPAPAPAPGTGPMTFLLRHPGTVALRSLANLGTILASTLPVTLYWPLVPLALIALFRPPVPGAWPVAVALGAMPLIYAPFSVDRRFFVPAVPLLLIACAAGFDRLELLLARAAGDRTARRIANATLAALIVFSVAYTFAKGAGFDSAPEHRRAGEWLRRNAGAVLMETRESSAAPEAARGRPIVMSRKPWVAFYAGGLIATLPDAPAESLAAIARRKGADIVVADERSARADRPGLVPLLLGSDASLGLVPIHPEAGPPALFLYRPR